MSGALTIAIVAGEESGDQLGGKLIEALHNAQPGIRLVGVGGDRMASQGLVSAFPLTDIAVMGFNAVIARLPTLVRRVYQAVDAIVAARPDILVIIDSPDFTHAVAKRVRKRLPRLPIIDYVSPSVWAWRPGRARKMRAYVDHVLALLPFEPAAHHRLGGPDCTYVGHPLIERLAEFRPAPGERPVFGEGRVKMLVLPGSRRSEISRLMEPFGAALGKLEAVRTGQVDLVLPAVDYLAKDIAESSAKWPIKPKIVTGEAAKLAAFRQAHVALAASGTVTLELALSGVPMLVAYKVSKLEEQIRHFLTVDTVVLPNLILGRKAFPERLQWDCTPEKLAEALGPLLADSLERRAQIAAFAELDAAMSIGHETPSERSANIVLDLARSGRQFLA